MNYAVIDLGSNTIHLAIFEFDDDKMTKIFSEKEVASIAGYISDGILSTEGITEACRTVNNLKEIALRTVEPSNLYLFAAASLRSIRNREEAVSTILRETSLVPDVLDGDEEAKIGFIGASMGTECDEGLMVDIGGASTELVLFRNGKVRETASMPVGSLNMYKSYVKGTVPSADEKDKICQAVDEQISRIEWADGVTCKRIVGIGGTIRAMQKLTRTLLDADDEQKEIAVRCVKDMIKLLKRGDDVYKTVQTTIPERVLTILPGLLILRQVIKKFGCETISVSRSGIRDGYIMGKVLKRYDIR